MWFGFFCFLSLSVVQVFTACDTGFYGPNCDSKCSPRCKNNKCNFISGAVRCTDGCKLGWYGTNCAHPCRSQNTTCTICPQKCESGYCQTDFQCVSGCEGSLYGTDCKKTCTKGYYGVSCDEKCNSSCKSECERLSGNCTGCKSGWFGSTCQYNCSIGCVEDDKGCDGYEACGNDTRNSTIFSWKEWTVAGLAVVVLVLLVVLYVSCCRARRLNPDSYRWRQNLDSRDQMGTAAEVNIVPAYAEVEYDKAGVVVTIQESNALDLQLNGSDAYSYVFDTEMEFDGEVGTYNRLQRKMNK